MLGSCICLWHVHGALARGAVPGAGAAAGVAVEAPLAAGALVALGVVQACLEEEGKKRHCLNSQNQFVFVYSFEYGRLMIQVL